MSINRFAVALMILFAIGCDDPTAPEPARPPDIRERIVHALPGDRLTLNVAGAVKRWTNTAPAVASVSEEGVVEALAPGWAVLVAEGTEKDDTLLVAVSVPFVNISAAFAHACGLTAEGVGYCWGDNYWYGELGIGHAGTVELTPVAIATEKRFLSLSTNWYHTCGVTTNHEIYCWGAADAGQLGTGDLPECANEHGPRGCSALPRRVASAVTFRSVSTGDRHTCAISTADEAYCWGNASFGEIGAPVTEECSGGWECATTPTKVATGERFRAVAAGWGSTCALTLDGRVFCWGIISRRYMGSRAPTLVETELRFEMIESGTFHTCGVTLAGKVYCWGANDSGELGSSPSLESTGTPRAVHNLGQVRAITAEFDRTCALKSDGSAACWGGFALPGLYDVTGTRKFSTISHANRYTCGIAVDDVPYCWGLFAPGLGVDASRTQPTPIAPPGPLPALIGTL